MAQLLLEVTAAVEALLLLPALPWLLWRYRGDGRQVLVIPGFRSGDRSTWPLRRFLRGLGYEALPWGLGRNMGTPDTTALRVIERLPSVRHADEPITLIGWSLGGVVAREVARCRPDWVREVITLGTPVEGGPKYTAGAARFATLHDLDLDRIEQHVHDINSLGILRPLTIVYSHSDGIVGWQACIDRYNPHARHERVIASHLGLGINPRVWGLIARTLQAP